MLKFKAAVHDIYIINPEAGLPYMIQIVDEDE